MGTFLSFRAYNTDNQLIIHSAAKFRFHKGTIKTGLILFLCYLILYFLTSSLKKYVFYN